MRTGLFLTYIILLLSSSLIARVKVAQEGISIVDSHAVTVDGKFASAINGRTYQKDALASDKDYQHLTNYDAHKAVSKGNCANNGTMRIDSHIHLYDTDRQGSNVFLDPEKHKKIYYPHLVSEFLAVASPAGVDYAVVVEASKRREDNFWLMEKVDKSDNLLAFIANLDPRDATFISDLDKLSKSKKFRGIRIRPKTPIDISSKDFIEKIGALAKRNLVLELRETYGPIEAIEEISRTYPNMNIVMDHMAGGRIQNGEIVPQSWNERLRLLSEIPNVYVKISMLYTLSGKSPAPVDYTFYRTFIDRVIDAFGPTRVFFGSNWTLSEMHGSYTNMIGICNQYVEENDAISQEQFYAENTIEAYGLVIKH
jgi:L-fuconolactonase